MVLDNQYYTVFFEVNHPDTKYFVNLKQYTTKKNKSILNTLNFYLEDDNNEEVDLNGETLPFALQMNKI